MKIKTIISLFKSSFSHWKNHRATRMGAALSFYTIFFIVPILMLILVAAGSFLGDDYIQTSIIGEVRNITNAQNANFVKSILLSFSAIKFDLYAIIVSIVALIAGTLGVFYELKNSLDDLWDTKQIVKESKSWKYFFTSRILSLSLIPVFGVLFLISLIFETLLTFISGYSQVLAKMTFIYKISTFIFSFFILSFLFTFIYRYLPKRKLPWKELVRGAVITAILFIFGKSIIDIYITDLIGPSFLGTAEAFVLFLLWVYYSVQIFLFGASITYVYSRRFGHLKDN